MFLLFIVAIVILSSLVRLVLSPFRYGRRYRSWDGYRYGYDNPYLYGCRRRHRFIGGLFPILALVALDRIFTRRY